MKKLLILIFMLLTTITYSKPITFLVLRYKGKVLDAINAKSDQKNDYHFEFAKTELTSDVIVDGVSSGHFYLNGSYIYFSVYKDIDKIFGYKLPKNFTITKETININ